MSASSYQPWLIPAIFLLLASPSLLSQQTTPAPTRNDKTSSQQTTPTFSSDVKVVNVLATVRDKHGQIVNNLTKDDFTLEQDGHPQTIHYFAKDTDLPLTLGLLVDTSMSQRRLIDQERTASYHFLDDLMRVDKDKAFVIHFDREVELLQDLTASRDKLEAALDKLGAPKFEDANGGSSGGGGGGGYPGGSSGHGRMGGGTTLYDTVFLASDELMRKQQGRKALILLTDGVDIGSKVSLDRAIETAQRANTLVYSIYYSDPNAYGNQGYGNPGMGRHGGWGGGGMGRYPGGGYPGGGYPQQTSRPDGKKVLQRISRETGGRFFEVSKKESVDQIYKQIEEELRNQYNLGFTPAKADATPGYHKITLNTNNKDLV
ncbi:MAG: VWA domain-containing protein, partial [Candidatus Korobacteraceae bacterium]